VKFVQDPTGSARILDGPALETTWQALNAN